MDASANVNCPNCFVTTSVTPCPACGWQPGAENQHPALALGTDLEGRYRIGRVLGHGGLGITYLAWDENQRSRLAIKEYLPCDSVTRAPDGVNLNGCSGPAAEQFADGLERFLEEARALAGFDPHPGMVSVKGVIRAHGTGYCLMDFVEGMTLEQFLARQPDGRLVFDRALRLLLPAMDALRTLHDEGVLHRDVAPDNIYVTRSGHIKLLGLGAAHLAAGEHGKDLSAILQTGYAPPEQYRTTDEHGPWTDVYGVAATLYRAVTGQVPPGAPDRLEQDELIPPSRLGAVISPGQETVLLDALALRTADRYASMMAVRQAWREVAKGPGIAPSPPPAPTSPAPEQPAELAARLLEQAPDQPTSAHDRPTPIALDVFRSRAWKRGLVAAGILCSAIVGLAFIDGQRVSDEPMQPSSSPSKQDAALDDGPAVAKSGDHGSDGLEQSSSSPSKQGPALDDGRAVAKSGDHESADQEPSSSPPPHPTLTFADGLAAAESGNHDLAMAAWRPLAEQGDAAAQFNLGVMYANGRGVERDEARAIQLYRAAAEQGLADAQFNLGLMYAHGRGVARDDAQAAHWYRAAAEQGLAAARSNLGLMYANGDGVARDPALAVRLYRQAAEQGNALGQFGLGWMYANGDGVARDAGRAVHLYRQAAEQGNAAAQYNLGLMYETGDGVTQDHLEAVAWYRRAAEQGDASARFSAIDLTTPRITQEWIEAMQKAGANLKARRIRSRASAGEIRTIVAHAIEGIAPGNITPAEAGEIEQQQIWWYEGGGPGGGIKLFVLNPLDANIKGLILRTCLGASCASNIVYYGLSFDDANPIARHQFAILDVDGIDTSKIENGRNDITVIGGIRE